VSIPEIHLRAAASAIDRMSSAELQQVRRKLKEKRNARTQMEVLQAQNELASLELDHAAYQLASEAESKGDLARAARWYTAAALNDFSDASLRLARILDALAEKHLRTQGGDPATREELNLVTEACRWYSDAILAGETEAYELLEALLERHFGQPRTGVIRTGAVQPDAQPSGPPQQPRLATDLATVRSRNNPIADIQHIHVFQDIAGD
jgi:TPR repeat protein